MQLALSGRSKIVATFGKLRADLRRPFSCTYIWWPSACVLSNSSRKGLTLGATG